MCHFAFLKILNFVCNKCSSLKILVQVVFVSVLNSCYV